MGFDEYGFYAFGLRVTTEELLEKNLIQPSSNPEMTRSFLAGCYRVIPIGGKLRLWTRK